jgi:hypothetical protein
MTGGIGFSRQGSDSFKQNRALRNKRKSMNGNPYSTHVKNENRGKFNLKELQYFRYRQERQSNLIRKTVFIGLIIIFREYLINRVSSKIGLTKRLLSLGNLGSDFVKIAT